MINIILQLQFLELDLVNINVYAKVYQNIPLSSRDRAIFTFSEFEPRQRLGQSRMTFDNLLATSCQYQCVCRILSKYSKRFKSYRHFSQTGWRHFHFFRIWTSATPRPIPNDNLQSLGLHLVNINAYAKFYQNILNSLRVINSFRHFSQTGRRQNLHKLSGDKINVWL